MRCVALDSRAHLTVVPPHTHRPEPDLSIVTCAFRPRGDAAVAFAALDDGRALDACTIALIDLVNARGRVLVSPWRAPQRSVLGATSLRWCVLSFRTRPRHVAWGTEDIAGAAATLQGALAAGFARAPGAPLRDVVDAAIADAFAQTACLR